MEQHHVLKEKHKRLGQNILKFIMMHIHEMLTRITVLNSITRKFSIEESDCQPNITENNFTDRHRNVKLVFGDIFCYKK